MTKLLRILPAVLLLSVAACGEEKKSSAASSASAAAPKGPEMEEVKNDKLGYSIQLPKGSKTDMSDENGGLYGHDTMIIKVEAALEQLDGPDNLMKNAMNVDGYALDKKTEGDVVLVVATKASNPTKVYAGPKGGKLAATCTAEPGQKDLAVKICSSVKATKK